MRKDAISLFDSETISAQYRAIDDLALEHRAIAGKCELWK